MGHRSSEELDGLLQAFPDVFKEQFGKELNHDTLVSIVQTILYSKEEQVIKQRFSDLTPKNLREVLEKLSQPREVKRGRGPKKTSQSS